MGNYFYSICVSGIVCGIVKRLTGEKYREIINFVCCLIVITAILQPFVNTKGISFEFDKIDYQTEETLSVIYSDELKSRLNTLLSENEYNAEVKNIYCECKDGEIMVLGLDYSGDLSAGVYLSEIVGIPQDRVLYSG